MCDLNFIYCLDDIGVGFLVKCNRAALEESGRRYREERSKLYSDGDVYVYLANENAEDTCTMMSPNTGEGSHNYNVGFNEDQILPSKPIS